MNPFHNKVVDIIVFEQIKKEMDEARQKIYEKYKNKLKEIKEKESDIRLDKFDMYQTDISWLKKDKDLKDMYYVVQARKSVTANMVKKVFKECINEVLDEIEVIDVNGEKVNPKTKRMILAEKIVKETIEGTITPNVLRGFEIIRDTIGEKPANEVISKGIEAKIIDVNITKEKIEKVKIMLDGLRNARITDGLEENFAIRRSDERPGNEGAVKADVSGESERVYNVDVLPDKQD